MRRAARRRKNKEKNITRNKFNEDERKGRSNKRQNSEEGGKGKKLQVNIIHKE